MRGIYEIGSSKFQREAETVEDSGIKSLHDLYKEEQQINPAPIEIIQTRMIRKLKSYTISITAEHFFSLRNIIQLLWQVQEKRKLRRKKYETEGNYSIFHIFLRILQRDRTKSFDKNSLCSLILRFPFLFISHSNCICRCHHHHM